MKTKIAIGSDHAGLEMKKAVIKHYRDDFEWLDAGTKTSESCDYPDYAKEVARLVKDRIAAFGILLCGSGLGMAMAANRAGVRAAPCTNPVEAELARRHNNAQVLCLGARLIGEAMMIAIVDTFLLTDFEGGRHQIRIDKIEAINQGGK